VKVLLIQLKTEIVKILVPFIIRNTLKYPEENPQTYNTQLEEAFTSFFNLCQIVEKISPGEEEHLMAFLEVFECYNAHPSKTAEGGLKTSEFLYKAIEALLELVFRGIRVRSYHFYKFIRIYLKLTK
jgi:hypothetical protein